MSIAEVLTPNREVPHGEKRATSEELPKSSIGGRYQTSRPESAFDEAGAYSEELAECGPPTPVRAPSTPAYLWQPKVRYSRRYFSFVTAVRGLLHKNAFCQCGGDDDFVTKQYCRDKQFTLIY